MTSTNGVNGGKPKDYTPQQAQQALSNRKMTNFVKQSNAAFEKLHKAVS